MFHGKAAVFKLEVEVKVKHRGGKRKLKKAVVGKESIRIEILGDGCFHLLIHSTEGYRRML